MSISRFQEKFLNKGCFTAFAVVAAIAMAASMFNLGRGGNASRGETSAEGASDAVVTVGDIPVPAALFEAKAREVQNGIMQRQAFETKLPVESLPPPGATVQATSYVGATATVLQAAAVQALLSASPVSDDEILAFGKTSIEQNLAGIRENLTATKKLKAGATDAEFEKALKDQLKGKTLAQVREEYPKSLLAAFKDASKKAAVLDRFGGAILVARLGKSRVSTDQALRDTYKSYVVRRIFLSDASGAKATAAERAAKAETDLKAGASFDALMDTVSNDPSPAGKKPHEVTSTIPAAEMQGPPDVTSLQAKSAKATTGVLDVTGGKAIYQLVSTKDGLPPNFERDKEKLRTERAQSLGQKEAERQVKAYLDGGSVKWRSKGFEALYTASKAIQNIGSSSLILDPAAGAAAYASATAALKSDNAADKRLAAQALIVVTDPKVSMIGSPDAAKNRQMALEAARDNGIDDAALDLELATIYGDAKDGTKATEALISASKANLDYGTSGQRIFGDIAAKALDLEKKKALTKAQVESIQAQQATWAASKAANEKAAAEAKVDAAKGLSSNEAEIRRQKAEAAKSASPGPSAPADAATVKKANDAEIARQMAEAANGAPAGSSR